MSFAEVRRRKAIANFLYFAKGSCGEVRSQIIRASDVGFIDNETATKLYNECINLNKSISKFITSIKSSGISGLKFQDSRSKFQEGDADLKPET